MGNKRQYMTIIIILLAIGFASTATSIYLNGTIGVTTNEDEFASSVIFKSVTPAISSGTEKSGTATISSDSKTITFTPNDFDTVGDTATLDFKIANNSTLYDANATIECSLTDSSYSDYLYITTDPDSYAIEAGSSASGEIQVKYKKSVTSEITTSFKCEIVASAVERTSLADATTDTTYNLNAAYVDDDGNGIANAVLVVASDPQVVVTDENGIFSVDNLEEGTHHLYYMGTTSEVTSDDFKNKSINEIKEAAKDTSTFIVNDDDTINVATNSNIELVTNLYNMMKANASDDIIDFNVNSETSKTNGIYKTTETQDGSEVYYYRGNVDNNLVFNNMCWKIIRTTETGGVKLIYNGVPISSYSSYDTLTKDDYTYTNDSTYAFSYDNGTWTSTNKSNSSISSISLTGLSGNYITSYTVSSETNYDKMKIYLNGTLKETQSGTVTSEYEFKNLITTDIIKIEYSKDGSASSGLDQISFSLTKGNGDMNLSCKNTGENTGIGSSAYVISTSINSTDLYYYQRSSFENAYIGYMYGSFDVSYTNQGMSSSISNNGVSSTLSYYYGTDYSFNSTTGEFTLSGTVVSGLWSENYSGYYTCFNANFASCYKMYLIRSYVDSTNASVSYFNTLYNGSTSYSQAHENSKNSSIKSKVDSWYKNNFTDSSITSKIEDTVYCSDRSVASGGDNNAYSSNSVYGPTKFGYGNYYTIYGSSSRSSYYTYDLKPSLNCSQSSDRFTVDKTNGNGALTYPVGLITLDEAVFAGFNSYNADKDDYNDNTNYLNSNSKYFTMTPTSTGRVGTIVTTGSRSGADADKFYGMINDGAAASTSSIRPVISLASGAYVLTSGDGSKTNPYVIY